MNAVESLLEARKYAGLAPLSEEAVLDLVEKKLSGKDKEEFLAKMGGKKKKKDEVDGGSNNSPSAGAKTALDKASIKGSVSGEKGPEVKGGKGPGKGKKKVSEHLNDVLVGAGLQALSEADAAKVDEKYPDADADE